MFSGKLIVLEGPDDAGKTTIAHAIVRALQKRKIACQYESFPGRSRGTLGRVVYELHHTSLRNRQKRVDPVSLQMLHVAAHVDAIRSRILPALTAGSSVVLDRYWWSTWVYGRALGVESRVLRKLLSIEWEQWGAVRPDCMLVIFRNVVGGPRKSRERRLLTQRYRVMAGRVRDNCSPRIIHNDGAVKETVGTILSFLEQSFGMPGGARSGNVIVPRPASKPVETGEVMRAPDACVRLSPAKPTVVYDTLWRFAAERSAIFFRRLQGEPPPWTNDSILRQYRFTNAYRASDRVSQYLIKHVIYEGDSSVEEVVFRVLLFKLFNRIETWEMLKSAVGRVCFSEYSFERLASALERAIRSGKPIYSAAYIMPPGGSILGESRKHRAHLRLLERMMRDELPARLGECRSMKSAFELLKSFPTIGDFLAYQFLIDINYSQVLDFSEMDFVMPGPGARNGIRKCFRDLGGLNEVEIIRVVADRQEAEFERLGLSFHGLWGRRLQLVDCQNLFCEVDKYARIAHPEFEGVSKKLRIKQRYRPNAEGLDYWFPPKWGINGAVAMTVSQVRDDDPRSIRGLRR